MLLAKLTYSRRQFSPLRGKSCAFGQTGLQPSPVFTPSGQPCGLALQPPTVFPQLCCALFANCKSQTVNGLRFFRDGYAAKFNALGPTPRSTSFHEWANAFLMRLPSKHLPLFIHIVNNTHISLILCEKVWQTIPKINREFNCQPNLIMGGFC